MALNMTTGKEYWNNEAKQWKNSHGLGERAENARSFIRDEVGKFLPTDNNDLILNLGAGNDFQSLNLWNPERIISLDYAHKMLDEDCIFKPVEADVRDALPILDSSVGMVCSFFLMRYLSHEQRVALLTESDRLLKPGGYVLFIDVPDNSHFLQVEKFDPSTLVDAVSSLGMELKRKVSTLRKVGRYVETGFGGWHEGGSYVIGSLVAMKKFR